MTTREIAVEAAQILDRKGGLDIIVLDVAHLTSVTDYFVIATGRNVQAVRAIAEDLVDKLSEQGIEPRRREGARETKWLVLDYEGVIVHIFHPDDREYYSIERLWEDGTNRVEFERLEDE